MLTVGEAYVCAVQGQRVYGKSLYLPLNFAENQKLLQKILLHTYLILYSISGHLTTGELLVFCPTYAGNKTINNCFAVEFLID